MQSTTTTATTTRIRRFACTVGLALTGLAALATGAAAGGSKALECELRAQACMTKAEYRALTIGSAALNRTRQAEEFIPGVTDFPSRIREVGDSGGAVSQEQFVPGVTDFPSRLGENGERAAEARLTQRSRQELPVYVQADESGFDWSAAATGAVAATLLLLGAALAVRTVKPKPGRIAVG